MKPSFAIIGTCLTVVSLLVVTARKASTQVGGVQPAYVRLQSSTPGAAQSGNANVTGTLKAGIFEGVGTGLTNVNAEAVGGFPASAFGRVSTTNIWTGGNTFTNAGNSFTGSGAGLTGVNADRLDGLDSSAFLQAVPVPLVLTGSNNTGIVQATNSSALTNSSAIRGTATSQTGVTYGGVFQSSSSSGTGVYASGPMVGVTGESFIANGIGVQGRSLGGDFSRAVAGFTNGPNSMGVWGENTNTTSGVSLFGLAGSRLSGQIASLIGVFGEANGISSAGVYGFNSNSGTGVMGRSSGTNGAGIIGQGISGARAGVFLGDVDVVGKIVKDYGATSPEAVPIAYGTVGSLGTVVNGSGNWTVVWNAGTSSYEITIAGHNYTSNMTSVVTPIANSVPRIGGVAPVGSDLGVTFFSIAGSKVQVGFHFAVFDPQ